MRRLRIFVVHMVLMFLRGGRCGRRRRRTAHHVESARGVRGEEEGKDEGEDEGEACVRCVRDEDAAADGKGGGS